MNGKKNINSKIVSLFLLFFLFLPVFVSASNFFEESTGLKKTAEKTGHTSQKLFGEGSSIEWGAGSIINVVLSFIGVIFMILMIYGGVLWMIAMGNDQRVEKAKNIITQSIIGLFIVLLAYAISFFVINIFTSNSLLK